MHSSASALQHGNVLLTAYCAGVMIVDDFNAGARITCQCYQIYALTVQQPECDGTVAQAVQAAWVAVCVEFQTSVLQHPVKHVAKHVHCVLSIGNVWQEHMVICIGTPVCSLVLTYLLVNAHSWLERHNGRTVQLGLRQCQPQISLLTVHNFYMTVSQFDQVAWSYKAVDHKANCPSHVWWHFVVVVALVQLFTHVFA